MLALLRIIFGLALVYTVTRARSSGATATESLDMTASGWLSVSVLLGIANAAVWASLIGAKLSDPLTDAITSGSFSERNNWTLKLVYWFQERRWRRLTLVACFLEGIHRPNMPTAFVIGLNHAREGSWLEKVFAREVFRFDNAQNCLRAYRVLQRHHLEPGIHARSEVNLLVHSLNRSVAPPPEILPVPAAPPTEPIRRNPAIQLFESAGAAADPARPKNSAMPKTTPAPET